MSEAATKQPNHPPVKCRKTGHGHYHYKNWSYDFVCPHCGRTGRFSINFLGQRSVICDGSRFHRIPLTFGGFKDAGLSFAAFLDANPESKMAGA